MTVEGATASSSEELIVSVEQANALIDLIGIREGHNGLFIVGCGWRRLGLLR